MIEKTCPGPDCAAGECDLPCYDQGGDSEKPFHCQEHYLYYGSHFLCGTLSNAKECVNKKAEPEPVGEEVLDATDERLIAILASPLEDYWEAPRSAAKELLTSREQIRTLQAVSDAAQRIASRYGEQIDTRQAENEALEKAQAICHGTTAAMLDGKPLPGNWCDGTDAACPGWWRGMDFGWDKGEEKRKALEAKLAKVVEAATELIEVAELRGDNELPHPVNDDKLWTARMQDGWDNLGIALSSLHDSVKGKVLVDRVQVDFHKNALEIKNLEIKCAAKDMGIELQAGEDAISRVHVIGRKLFEENKAQANQLAEVVEACIETRKWKGEPTALRCRICGRSNQPDGGPIEHADYIKSSVRVPCPVPNLPGSVKGKVKV